MLDENVFVPTKNTDTGIVDITMIQEAVNCYFDKQFKAMTGFIMEYGEVSFFIDLFTYFELGWWKNPGNKYLTFAGIVTEYFKTWS